MSLVAVTLSEVKSKVVQSLMLWKHPVQLIYSRRKISILILPPRNQNFMRTFEHNNTLDITLLEFVANNSLVTDVS